MRVLFFGRLRDLVGVASEELELDGPVSLRELYQRYAAQQPALATLADSVMVARNEEFAQWSDLVQPGDEVAFLPPVSGGTGEETRQMEDEQGNFFALTRNPIDVESLKRRIASAGDGAIVVFEGVARNQTGGRLTRFLEYEAYEGLALKMMARLGQELIQRHAISRVGIVHRLGRVEIGQASVAIVVAAPHRAPAFAAAQEAIDRLKVSVPIWKKEYFVDGEVWVEGSWELPALPR